MKAGLIAAGHGERLRAGGIKTPKPLVEIAGIPLVDRLLWALAISGVHEVACIFNEEEGEAVEKHCKRASQVPLKIERKTTPNSMESLFTLAPHLSDTKFLLMTVDVVFGPTALPNFFRATAKFPNSDAVIAVNRYVDDEKPLRVKLDDANQITAIGPEAGDSPIITAGFYLLSPTIFKEMDAARAAGCSALRDFFGHLLKAGYSLHGAMVPKTIDVDRPEDIAAAEKFVQSGYEG